MTHWRRVVVVSALVHHECGCMQLSAGLLDAELAATPLFTIALNLLHAPVLTPPSCMVQAVDFMRGMGLGILADQLADLKLGELLNTPPPGGMGLWGCA